MPVTTYPTYGILRRQNEGTWYIDQTQGSRQVVLNRIDYLLQTEVPADTLRMIQLIPILANAVTQEDRIDIDHFSILNDGTQVKVGAFFADTPGGGQVIAIDIDHDMKAALIATMSELGLTNIELNTWNGLTATNPTGTPIHATYTLPEGFFTLYKTADGFNAISKTATIVLE